MGCQGRVGLRHVAEYADEWCPIDVGFRDVAQGIEWFNEAVVKADRDPASIPISMYCFGAPNEATMERYRDLGVARVVFGAPDKADAHERFVDKASAPRRRVRRVATPLADPSGQWHLSR